MKGKRGHKNKKDKNKAPPPAPPLPASGDDKADVAQSGSKVKLKLITPKPIESQTDTNQSSPPMLSVADTANSSKPSLKPHKQELDTALHIIKKVMKMDAAEPFNVPVNPEALGIPDYFDVIDTPMDFGTICSNLEMGVKYNSSEDVYRDVQYIWDNCYKYNNKGDYIVDLMKRVKKNFAKYWTTAGLYSGPATGVESSQDNGSPSDQMKVHIKGAQLKPKGKKLHGRRHKSDCLCAICVLKRRRREREANAQMVKSPLGAIDSNLSQEFRQEESSHAESPGENSSSDMDGSLDPNADAKVEETEDSKTGLSKQRFGSLLKEKQEEEEDDDEEDEEESEVEGDDEGLQQVAKSREEPNIPSQPISAKLDAGILTYSKRKASGQHEERIEAVNQEKEVQEIHKKAKLSKNLQFENPMLVDLCGILFPNNNKSIWNGPHSLAQQHTSRNSSIHAAIDMLMK